MVEQFRFIAPVPRLRSGAEEWLVELRKLEALGFDAVAISEHFTRGWQLSAAAAMAFAAASTSKLRVLSLVMQSDFHHPALLAKEIATIDVLSGGRVELGLGAGWLAEDYSVLGQPFESSQIRIARLAEALRVIRQYFERDFVDFDGEYFRITGMEALPRSVQQPNPPILVGAGGPRMLDLAGRLADIVGVHARMDSGAIGQAAVADLTAASIEVKIDRVRAAAAAVGRPPPRLQFSCYHVRVTDAPEDGRARSSWSSHMEGALDSLRDSPAVLVGTTAECAEKLRQWRDRLGITYWHLGPNVEAVSGIVAELRSH